MMRRSKPSSVLALLSLASALSLLPASFCQSSSPDAPAMLELRRGLTLPSSIEWSNPNPCDWKQVDCDSNKRVTRIQLGNSGVSGNISSAIANLTSLQVLELYNTSISGHLPSLPSLSSLQTLNILDCQFNFIPTDFFDGLSSLQEAYLDNNPFQSWWIPEGLSTAASLKNFSANSANIVGKIPGFLNSSTFPGMIQLHLSGNSLEGGLPIGFSGFSIQSLWLNGQKSASGTRSLNGSIDVLTNMTNLVEIWLNLNGLTGPIPDLSGLTSLSYLDLRDNSLTGVVPTSLTNLALLRVVNLTNNDLQGSTPKFPTSVSVDMINGTNSFCLPDPGVACNGLVNALIKFLEPFGYPLLFAQNWPGNDPCSNWMGITCSNGNITTINLQGKGLAGTISPVIATITSVEVLVLSHNNITGTIPTELASMPNLKRLDVSFNQLYGKVPSFAHTVVNTAGNADIGQDHTSTGGSFPPESSSGTSSGGGGSGNASGSNTGKVVGFVIGGVCVAAIAGICAFFLFRRNQKKLYGRRQSPNAVVVHPNPSGSDDAIKITILGSDVNGGMMNELYTQGSSGPSDVHVIEANNMVISIQVLRSVTNNFSEENILGRGGFGTVYKGELHDGTKIAVKRMDSGVLGDKGLTEFKSEIAVLTKVRHRHLVSLLGYCLDGNEKLLVYEYMPQGTLSRHLFNWKEEGLKPLEWKQRLIIALDVARGVEYLHNLAQQSFIHRDLKPSNILLGYDMRAKVSDFGLVRPAPDGKASIQTKLAGTFGYLSPEYAVTGRVTTKLDVYSFGAILMEMITGRKALDETLPEDSMYLVTWFRRVCINKDTFQKAIDPTIILDEEILASINTVSELAGHCTAREPYQRPNMGHVVNVLSSLVEMWKPASGDDSGDLYGIDFDMSLPQALKKWQALESSASEGSSMSSFFASRDSTQTSIPTRPTGFASSFASADGR